MEITIKRVPPEFQPVQFTITCKTVDELIALRALVGNNDIAGPAVGRSLYPEADVSLAEEFIYELRTAINEAGVLPVEQ
jgi:hypothetical protein